jgi:hypothetical protein
MASFAIHPPVHLTIHPDEPIRTIEAAAKVVARHMPDRPDPATRQLVDALTSARTPDQADAAGRLFMQWVERNGLLLAPPATISP